MMRNFAKTATASPVTASHEQAASRQYVEPTLFNLFWIFVIASVIGLVGETVVSAFVDGYVKSRAGLVWGPFSPLYGLGAVLMTLALNGLKGKSKLLVFSVAAFVGGATEFVAGWFWKNFFGIVAWSYIDQPLNFFGYTCAGMMVVWGLAGLAWVTVGIPLMMRLIGLIPVRMRKPLTIILAVFMTADIAVTLMSFGFWFERLEGKPVVSPMAAFFAQYYGNDWMANRFQALSMWTSLAFHH